VRLRNNDTLEKRMTRFLFACLPALLIGGLAASPARAALLDFTYASTPTITAASANPPGTTNTITNGITIGGLPAASFVSVAPTGTSSIAITGRTTSSPQDAQFGDNTPFLDVTITSNDTATRTFSVNYDAAYVLTDPTPGGGPGPQTIHFLGKLTGQINGSSPGSTNVSFSVADFTPAIGAGPVVNAGDGSYKVILKSFSDPGLGATSAGHLTAFVSSAPVPEPTSAMLAIGGSILAMCRRRR
jgi:hypothetical protein